MINIKKSLSTANKSITTKLIGAFLILIITPVLIIGYTSFKFSEEIILNKVRLSTSKTLEQAASNIDTIFNSMVYASNTINLNRNVEEILSGKITEDMVQQWKEAQLTDNLFTSINSTFLPYHSYFTIIGNNGKVFTSWNRYRGSIDNLKSQMWYRDAEKGSFSWTPEHDNYVLKEEDQYRKLFTLSRGIQREVGSEVYGICIVSIPHDEIINILKEASAFPESRLLITSEDNNVLVQSYPGIDEGLWKKDFYDYEDGKKGYFVNTYNKEKYMVNYHKLNRNSWKVVEIIPYDSLLGEIKELRSKITLFLVLFVILFIIISSIIALSITTPIRKLSKSMKKVENGDLSVRVDTDSEDEIGMLIRSFNKMVTRIKDLIDKLYEEQKRERELEIEALQAQIKPHFLFNTLNSIRWVAIMSQAENVSDMIGALSSLLKMSISSSDKFITIEEELENVKNYILIQKIRYNSRFDTLFNIDPEILKYKALKLILQPIVENSILHGFDKKYEGSIITISGKKVMNDVVIHISDNGKGMDPIQVESLTSSKTTGEKAFSGIGVSNVHQRLQLNFGGKYGLKISSNIDEGTVVEIVFPVIE